MRPAIAVTGVGAVCALGHGVPALRDAILAGRHGIVPIPRDRFDVSAFGARGVGALVPDAPIADRWIEWTLSAAREALSMAGFDRTRTPSHRVAVVMGTSLGHGDELIEPTHTVARRLGLTGPVFTFSTACTSSANAIGFARDLLLRGDVDLALAGGADELTQGLFAGFAALGVLAEGPCAPFGPVVGTTLGEGAGFVVLERDDDRSAPALGYLAGYGLSSDAWHETSPDPRGTGVARALRGALSDARWTPSDVDYINAHATGTASNDEAETRGITDALGEAAVRVPVSASKSFLGHAQGAAGALELIATLVCVERGVVPPSMRAELGRKGCPVDTVAGATPRAHAVERFLSTSSAFGGANAALALGRSAALDAAIERPVYLLGSAVITGPEVSSLRDEASFRKRVPSADPRSLDPLARFVVGACAAALEDAKVRLAGPLRDRAGIVVGAPRVSWESARAWRESVEVRGYTRVNANAFARLVLHAAAGSASKALSLRGVASTLAGGSATGLAAAVYAAQLLATRDDTELVVAGGAEDDEHARCDHEGAAMVTLGLTPGAGAVRVAASAFAGPGRDDEAMGLASARARVERTHVEWLVVERGAVTVTAAVATLVRAAHLVRTGTPHAGVVACDAGLSCAVILSEV